MRAHAIVAVLFVGLQLYSPCALAQDWTACSDLRTALSQPQAPSASTTGTCYGLNIRYRVPTRVAPTTLSSLTWNAYWQVAMLSSGSDIIVDSVLISRALVFKSSHPSAFLPAIFDLQGPARVIVQASVIITTCDVVEDMQTALPRYGANFSTQGAITTTIAFLDTTRVQFTNVTVSCDPGMSGSPTAVAAVATGTDLQTALSAVSALSVPGNISLLSHITLVDVKDTWPPAGYPTRAVTFRAAWQPNTRMVLDLAGVSGLVQLQPGDLARFVNVQLQGLCMINMGLTPQVSIYSVGDVYPVFSQGAGGPTAQRTVKLVELTNVTGPLTQQELLAGLYWLHITSVDFSQLFATGLAGISAVAKSIALPDSVLAAVNASAIVYRASTAANVDLKNVVETSQLPEVVQGPGFDTTTYRWCNDSSQAVSATDPRLSAPTLPAYVVQDPAVFTPYLVNSTALASALAQQGKVMPPILFLIMGNAVVADSLTDASLLLQTDMMIYGPDVMPPGPVPPGNPTPATINMTRSWHVVRLPEGSSWNMYLARVTLVGLPTLPLSAASKVSQADLNLSKPQYALPLWFLRRRDSRSSAAGPTLTQLSLSQVTLQLPKEEWKQLYYAAVRNTAWHQGMGASQPLIQGLTTLRVGSAGATPAGVHFDQLIGWDVNATNLWVVPEQPITAAELPPESLPSSAPATAAQDPQLGAPASGGDTGLGTGAIVGAVVGSVVGALMLVLLAAILILLVRRRQRRPGDAESATPITAAMKDTAMSRTASKATVLDSPDISDGLVDVSRSVAGKGVLQHMVNTRVRYSNSTYGNGSQPSSVTGPASEPIRLAHSLLYDTPSSPRSSPTHAASTSNGGTLPLPAHLIDAIANPAAHEANNGGFMPRSCPDAMSPQGPRLHARAVPGQDQFGRRSQPQPALAPSIPSRMLSHPEVLRPPSGSTVGRVSSSRLAKVAFNTSMAQAAAGAQQDATGAYARHSVGDTNSPNPSVRPRRASTTSTQTQTSTSLQALEETMPEVFAAMHASLRQPPSQPGSGSQVDSPAAAAAHHPGRTGAVSSLMFRRSPHHAGAAHRDPSNTGGEGLELPSPLTIHGSQALRFESRAPAFSSHASTRPLTAATAVSKSQSKDPEQAPQQPQQQEIVAAAARSAQGQGQQEVQGGSAGGSSTSLATTGTSPDVWDPRKQVAALAQEMAADGDKLQLYEAIGQGGFGAVYRGRWRGLEVAIKTVLFSSQGGALGPQQRAIMEAAVCSSVLHPNVVTTYHYDVMPMSHRAHDSSQSEALGGLKVEDLSLTKGGAATMADWKLFLIQEFCHASLYSVLTSKLMHVNGWPDLDLLLTTLLDIANGMLYLHSKNILHGDLKPENVLLKNDTTAAIGVVAKITDFGLATRLDPTMSHISNITNGTPFYAAPEVISRGQISKPSDVYSFGVLMWEMFLATPPWIKTNQGYIANALFPTLPSVVPARYANLTKSCLNHDHRQRPDFANIIFELMDMHRCFLHGFDALEHPSTPAHAAVAPEPMQLEQAQVVAGAAGFNGSASSAHEGPSQAASLPAQMPQSRGEAEGAAIQPATS